MFRHQLAGGFKACFDIFDPTFRTDAKNHLVFMIPGMQHEYSNGQWAIGDGMK